MLRRNSNPCSDSVCLLKQLQIQKVYLARKYTQERSRLKTSLSWKRDYVIPHVPPPSRTASTTDLFLVRLSGAFVESEALSKTMEPFPSLSSDLFENEDDVYHHKTNVTKDPKLKGYPSGQQGTTMDTASNYYSTRENGWMTPRCSPGNRGGNIVMSSMPEESGMETNYVESNATMEANYVVSHRYLVTPSIEPLLASVKGLNISRSIPNPDDVLRTTKKPNRYLSEEAKEENTNEAPRGKLEEKNKEQMVEAGLTTKLNRKELQTSLEEIEDGREVASDREEVVSDRTEVVSDRKDVASDCENVGSNREEVGSDRKEVVNDRKEIGSDREEVASDREEVASYRKARAHRKTKQSKTANSSRKTNRSKTVDRTKRKIQPQNTKRIDEILTHTKNFISTERFKKVDKNKKIILSKIENKKAKKSRSKNQPDTDIGCSENRHKISKKKCSVCKGKFHGQRNDYDDVTRLHIPQSRSNTTYPRAASEAAIGPCRGRSITPSDERNGVVLKPCESETKKVKIGGPLRIAFQSQNQEFEKVAKIKIQYTKNKRYAEGAILYTTGNCGFNQRYTPTITRQPGDEVATRLVTRQQRVPFNGTVRGLSQEVNF